MMGRLPVAPRPYRDELLSSWLGRVACRYGFDAEGLVGALFADGEGDAHTTLIDDAAPPREDIAFWPRPNSRVTSRQMAQSIGSRAAMSSSKRPYGFTCSQISGVRARRSLGVSFPDHCDCASTCCNMRVLM